MEREANYITVGAFVLLIIALAAWFVVWYTDAQDRRDSWARTRPHANLGKRCERIGDHAHFAVRPRSSWP